MDFLKGKNWLSRNGTVANTKALIYGNINRGNVTDFFPVGSDVRKELFRNFDQSEVFSYKISSKLGKFAYTYIVNNVFSGIQERRAISNFYYCGKKTAKKMGLLKTVVSILTEVNTLNKFGLVKIEVEDFYEAETGLLITVLLPFSNSKTSLREVDF